MLGTRERFIAYDRIKFPFLNDIDFKKSGVIMKRIEWIRCPVCTNKTRDRIREDTILKNYPLYCPKCKQESLIDAKSLNIIVIKEPDAKTQSR